MILVTLSGLSAIAHFRQQRPVTGVPPPRRGPEPMSSPGPARLAVSTSAELPSGSRALGHEDAAHPIINWRTEREPLESFARFAGFQE